MLGDRSESFLIYRITRGFVCLKIYILFWVCIQINSSEQKRGIISYRDESGEY